MNAYDFDGTIYNGQSTLEFYLFCLKNNPILLNRSFISFNELFKLAFMYESDNSNKFWEFLKYFSLDEKEYLVEQFWKENRNKIKSWYLKQKKEDDVIISLTPEFLLRGICDYLELNNLIGSQICHNTGAFERIPCKMEEKVNRFKEKYDDMVPDAFYTDHVRLDMPMLIYSKKGYVVRNNKIIPYKK